MSVGSTDPKVGTNAGECPPWPYKSASCKQQPLLSCFVSTLKRLRATVKELKNAVDFGSNMALQAPRIPQLKEFA